MSLAIPGCWCWVSKGARSILCGDNEGTRTQVGCQPAGWTGLHVAAMLGAAGISAGAEQTPRLHNAGPSAAGGSPSLPARSYGNGLGACPIFHKEGEQRMNSYRLSGYLSHL